jgi:transposase
MEPSAFAMAKASSGRSLKCSMGQRFGVSCDSWNTQEAGRRVVVITDNAKYHHAKLHADWRQEHQERFALDFLPPYSPELNPIERVWKSTRRNRLHNVYFPKLTLVVEAVEEQFAKWSAPNAELASLCKL